MNTYTTSLWLAPVGELSRSTVVPFVNSTFVSLVFLQLSWVSVLLYRFLDKVFHAADESPWALRLPFRFPCMKHLDYMLKSASWHMNLGHALYMLTFSMPSLTLCMVSAMDPSDGSWEISLCKQITCLLVHLIYKTARVKASSRAWSREGLPRWPTAVS